MDQLARPLVHQVYQLERSTIDIVGAMRNAEQPGRFGQLRSPPSATAVAFACTEATCVSEGGHIVGRVAAVHMAVAVTHGIDSV